MVAGRRHRGERVLCSSDRMRYWLLEPLARRPRQIDLIDVSWLRKHDPAPARLAPVGNDAHEGRSPMTDARTPPAPRRARRRRRRGVTVSGGASAVGRDPHILPAPNQRPWPLCWAPRPAAGCCSPLAVGRQTRCPPRYRGHPQTWAQSGNVSLVFYAVWAR